MLLLDEPTRGLDIKAKRDVHDVVRKLAAEGKGVIVSSSEADEIAALCHRALVLSRGAIAGELSARRADRRQHPEAGRLTKRFNMKAFKKELTMLGVMIALAIITAMHQPGASSTPTTCATTSGTSR